MTHQRCNLIIWFLTLATVTAVAQTDVTSSYLVNPSFEADAGACTNAVRKSESADGLRGWDVTAITGWTTTRPDKQLLITADCFTDNNFGKTSIADGTYAFFQRMGWNDGSSTIQQTTTTQVPAGKYLLTLKTKAFYANGGSSAVVQAKTGTKTLGSSTIDFAKGSAGCMASGEWTAVGVRFTLSEAAAVTIIGTKDGASSSTYVEFIADRPFLYVISERSTGTIFFIGQYMGDGTTGVGDAVRLNEKVKKVNDKYYNLNGQRLQAPPARGLYIRGGRKLYLLPPG